MNNIIYKQLLKTLKLKIEKEFDIEPETFVIQKLEGKEKLIYHMNDKQVNTNFPRATIDLFEAKIKEIVSKERKMEVEVINSLILEFDFKNELISCIGNYNGQHEFNYNI